MANHGQNSGLKRLLDGKNDTKPKHQRIDADEVIPPNGMLLTDLIDEFLEPIFMYLDPIDFVNIAHTSKHLKSAADMAFKRKYGETEFEFCNDRYHWYDLNVIDDKKNQLRLLRSFGHLITKLAIKPWGKFGGKLLDYSNEYCSNSLTVFRMHRFAAKWTPNKPFSSVEVVEFFYCSLNMDMNLNQWFPAICRLGLHWCKGMFIVKNLPQLEHLKIHDNRFLSPTNILASLQLNPQLRTLFLYGIDPPIQFWDACQLLTQLECLEIQHYYEYLFPNVDAVVNFNALRKLDTFIRNNEDLCAMTSKMTFDHLEDVTLEFGLFVNLAATYQWSKFFKKNPSIEKVTLKSSCNNNIINVSTMAAIAQELPLLREFVNFAGWFSVDDILEFVGKFDLTRYGFELKDESEFNEVEKRLGAGWDASIIGLCVELNLKL